MQLRNKNIALCLMTVLCTTCSENDVVYDIGEYKVDLATVCIDNNKQYFLLDDNTLLLNENGVGNIDSERVLLNYSYLEKKVPGFDHVIKVNGLSPVKLGKLLEVNPLTIDTITNHLIHLESAWIGSRYLNISFYMNFHSEKHAVSLITNKTKINENEITVYFRHNAYNDPPGSRLKVIVSFDLSNVLGEPAGGKSLIVSINSDDNAEKKCLLQY
jgi:hypothetical protein